MMPRFSASPGISAPGRPRGEQAQRTARTFQVTFLSSRAGAYACLALSMSLVGSYVALSKPLVAAIPVFLLAWLRFGIGGLAMLPWLRKPASEAPPTPPTRRLLFLESFLRHLLFSLCMLSRGCPAHPGSAGGGLGGGPAAGGGV